MKLFFALQKHPYVLLKCNQHNGMYLASEDRPGPKRKRWSSIFRCELAVSFREGIQVTLLTLVFCFQISLFLFYLKNTGEIIC